MNINLNLAIIAIVWCLLITVVLVWLYFIFKTLIKFAKDKEILNNTKEIKQIKNDFEDFKKISQNDIQKTGLVKYNPFDEAGGNNSFSLALLDGNKNGIIITSLHARERTRLYVKEVSQGKSKLELSNEEQKALKLSLK